MYQKSKNFNFCIFGKKGETKNPDVVKSFVKDVKDSEQEILQIFNEKINGNKTDENNFYEQSKGFTLNDLMAVLDCLKEDLNKLEYNQLLKNYSEYFDTFGVFFEEALAYSIFEYQLVNIYAVDRDDYEKFKENKDNCNNVVEKLLFHGTSNKFTVLILKTCIDISRNTSCKIGHGFY